MIDTPFIHITRSTNNADVDSVVLELDKLFLDRPKAREFLSLYDMYCNAIDDQIDEPKNDKLTRLISTLSAQIFNCDYWQQYNKALFLLERVIHNTYFDSTIWEKSEEQWKRVDARVMSHVALHMILAVIIIEYGEEIASKYSLRLREYAHERHKHDPI